MQCQMMEPKLAKELHQPLSITPASEVFVPNEDVAYNSKSVVAIYREKLRMANRAELRMNYLEGEMIGALAVKVSEIRLQLRHG